MVSAVAGNAAAGGVMLALAADEVWAEPGAEPALPAHGPVRLGVLDAHPAAQGGHDMAMELTESCWPLGTREALKMGFLDASLGGDVRQSVAELTTHSEALARDPQFWNQLKAKHARRVAAERAKPARGLPR